jgi:hypothetical protein
LSGGIWAHVRRLEIWVEVGRPVIYPAKLLNAFEIGSRVASVLLHQTGDAQKSFGKMAFKARWLEIWTEIPIFALCRKRNAPKRHLIVDAA